MKIEMLRGKLYRENHCGAGMVVEVDGGTGEEWVRRGWAKPYFEADPLTVAEAEELVPTKIVRRRAKL